MSSNCGYREEATRLALSDLLVQLHDCIMRPARVFPLFAIAALSSPPRWFEGDGDDGGGNGGGAGDQHDKGSKGGGAAEGLTIAKVNELINKALGTRIKAVEEKVAKTIATSIAEANTGLLTQFEQLLAPMRDKGNTENGGKGGGSDFDPEKHPAFVTLKKQNQALAKSVATLEEERDAGKKRSRQDNLRLKVNETLQSLGVDPKRIKHAAAVLFDGEAVRYQDDDSDSIVFRDSDGSDVELAAGLKSWVATEEGKFYLPPRGAGGSGERGGGGGGTNGAGKSAGYSREQLGTALFDLATR